MKWDISSMPDLKGKIAVITGANSGLGYQASLAMARKGAMVVLAVRSIEKGRIAAEKITREASTNEVIVMELDLADLTSVKNFTRQYIEKFNKLDILINNAGVMALPLRRTAQGHEMHLGTNHLGHFVLTSELIHILNKTPGARIINIGSVYKVTKVNFDDINSEKSYSKYRAYGQSKVANILFTIELDRRLKLANKTTAAIVVHPGWTATNLRTQGPEMEGSYFRQIRNKITNKLFAKKVSEGVLPILFVATSDDAVSGRFYGPEFPAEEKSDPSMVNPEDAARLWNVSEKLTGIEFLVNRVVSPEQADEKRKIISS